MIARDMQERRFLRICRRTRLHVHMLSYPFPSVMNAYGVVDVINSEPLSILGGFCEESRGWCLFRVVFTARYS